MGTLYSTDQQNFRYNENFIWLSRDEAGSFFRKKKNRLFFFFSQPQTVFGSKKPKKGKHKFAQTNSNLSKLTQSIFFREICLPLSPLSISDYLHCWIAFQYTKLEPT